MDRHEWSMMGADCFVLSCCCQFLILQILVFVLFKLPAKVYRKAKEYLKRKKLGIRKKVARCATAVLGQPPRIRRGSGRVVVESFRWDECMEEVEKVLEEMCKKGEFGFGSFWRGYGGDELDLDLDEDKFRICFVNQQLGYHDHDGNYHFIQVFGPLTMQLI